MKEIIDDETDHLLEKVIKKIKEPEIPRTTHIKY